MLSAIPKPVATPHGVSLLVLFPHQHTFAGGLRDAFTVKARMLPFRQNAPVHATGDSGTDGLQVPGNPSLPGTRWTSGFTLLGCSGIACVITGVSRAPAAEAQEITQMS